MQFAQMYHKSTGWNGKDFSGPVKNIPACGTDGVLVLDGRYSLARVAREARQYIRIMNNGGLRKGYTGFTVEAGETFTRAGVIRALELFDGKESA